MENIVRNKLRAIANGLSPKVNIGKDGLTDTIIDQIDVELFHREIVKVKINQNSIEDAKEVSNQVCDILGAECVIYIGGTFVLYKKSNKKGIEHII